MRDDPTKARISSAKTRKGIFVESPSSYAWARDDVPEISLEALGARLFFQFAD
jgi:hypothetical protein